MIRARRARGNARAVSRFLAPGAAILLLALSEEPAGLLFGQNPPTAWRVDPAQSRLVVNALPGGLLSSALHAHHFEPEEWSGEVAWDPDHPGSVGVEVRVATDSLRDHQPKLSAKDIAKVEGQVRGPEILDAARYPSIVFRAAEFRAAQLPSGGSGEVRGTLVGTLTLHGNSRPLQLPIQGRVASDRLEAAATATFKQSDFGIKPYKTALGTISVKDEITVEVSLVAVPK